MTYHVPTPQPGPAPFVTKPNPYEKGQCTWGMAQMCPCFTNYPHMGNGGQWYTSAQALGWQTSRTPVVGWGASFNVDPPYGDVGLIIAVNGDETVTRAGYNWHLDGKFSTDRVSQSLVIGAFKPPCDCTANGTTYSSSGSGQTSGNQAPAPATGARGGPCMYAVSIPGIPVNIGPWQSKIGGWNICMDGLIGVLAIGGGIAIMALAAFLAARPYIQEARGTAKRAEGVGTEAVGVATGQPEIAAAGNIEARQGASQAQRGQQTIEARRQAAQQARARRSTSADHLSVQEQETRRNLMETGYSAVQATRGARAAGSAGTREQRLMAGLRALGSTS